jgi:hypothetical protein
MSGARRLAPAALGAAALVAVALGACGRKGPPVAPEQRVPQAVSDLRGAVRGDRIELAWSSPRRRVDNSRLIDPGQARIFRIEDTGSGDPKPALLTGDRVAGYTEVGTIRLAEPASPLVGAGGRIAFSDRRDLTVGRRYTYVVVTSDAHGRTSPPSPRLSVTFLAAPEPPAGLQAEAGEREVRLNWQPTGRLTDGSAAGAPLVYEVLRAATAEAPLAPITRTEPGVTTVVDRNLENDRTYHYAVRAIRREGTASAEGEPSSRIAATPTDVTPPAPPADLVAIPSQGTVRLSWSPSPDADVSGYVIYRAPAGGARIRVGSVRVPATTFVDQDVPAGEYHYTVTAQDTSVRANESRATREARVSVP